MSSFGDVLPTQLTIGPVVRQVQQYIEDHYSEGISLAHVAAALHYSASHLTYLVRRETGRPVTAWIIERRLSAAKERLLTSDETVTAIAESVGFRDVTYFARQFARANGATPARWRMRSRNLAEHVV